MTKCQSLWGWELTLFSEFDAFWSLKIIVFAPAGIPKPALVPKEHYQDVEEWNETPVRSIKTSGSGFFTVLLPMFLHSSGTAQNAFRLLHI